MIFSAFFKPIQLKEGVINHLRKISSSDADLGKDHLFLVEILIEMLRPKF